MLPRSMCTMANTKKATRTKEYGNDTQDSRVQSLPGKMLRPIKVTMLGAGSHFTPNLISDVLQIPGEQGGSIALVDIDKPRLANMKRLIERIIKVRKKKNWTVTASTDRRKVLKGSDYIVCCIEVSGLECVRTDNDIPLKYGVSQCIGDTIGPGGLFKGLRTIPVWLEVLQDAERLCPEAVVLNYTNPMSMLCLSAARTSSMQVVGLCHSVQGTSNRLAKRAGVPYEEMEWECAGINHLAWFTKLRHHGKDLYPLLKKMARQDLAGKPVNPEDPHDLIRKDMMLQFGAFITESSGHLSEYLPYYRKRPDLLKTYAREGNNGEEGFYSRKWPVARKDGDARRRAMAAGKEPVDWPRTWEYASWIIEAREKNTPWRIHGNVPNYSRDGHGALITNLPHDGVVEVACLIDRNGVQPVRYGKLPPQMAAICDSNMRMYDLASTAAIEKSKEAAIHALMLDPLTAAVCSLAEIRKMATELFKAQAPYLPGYR